MNYKYIKIDLFTYIFNTFKIQLLLYSYTILDYCFNTSCVTNCISHDTKAVKLLLYYQYNQLAYTYKSISLEI